MYINIGLMHKLCFNKLTLFLKLPHFQKEQLNEYQCIQQHQHISHYLTGE